MIQTALVADLAHDRHFLSHNTTLIIYPFYLKRQFLVSKCSRKNE